MLHKYDKIFILKSLIFPVVFTVLLWFIKLLELSFNLDFASFGILPLKASGLIGILTAPFVHSDVKHLISNTFAIFFLTWAIFYFYSEIATWVFTLIYLLSGFWVWFFARDAYHIGASGLIYGMASFLFLSGVLRKHIPLAAISLVIVFLYGGIIWGVFPTIERVSWETHLTGLVAGIIIAIFYRNDGPQRPKPFADEDDEYDDFTDVTGSGNDNEESIEVKYHYKENN